MIAYELQLSDLPVKTGIVITTHTMFNHSHFNIVRSSPQTEPELGTGNLKKQQTQQNNRKKIPYFFQINEFTAAHSVVFTLSSSPKPSPRVSPLHVKS